MKTRFYNSIAAVAMTATLLLAFVSCGSSSDEDDIIPKEPTTNSYLTPGTDSRPQWKVTAGLDKKYPSSMSAEVTLQSELLPYVSAEDMMCVKIGAEIRDVKQIRLMEGEYYFPLVILGDGQEGGSETPVSLMYYCAKLTRIYTLEAWGEFNPDMPPTDKGKPYVITFFTAN